ncbi:hypothetical protein J3U62_12355, partial [Gilliamella sp. B3773]|nr:hypothetical protein [Gilliamella sp. B3722]MCX8614335.1 hypothetical protein [Gilliamella sp. B3773]MCX8621594.1 hypothetical protein [Gilliamella sp. B3892]MCX8624033.1 hypothetical protein [Gilliamella sp. B3759]MCX8631336.1 hypothetical protein [Gilliamella sp. B3724]MCX8636216.1 hypothetical protein [Gilliamella sp. B3758]
MNKHLYRVIFNKK